MPGCAINGCDREHYGRGWCSLHYQRWKRWGNPVYTAVRPPRLSAADVVAYELKRATRESNGCIIPTSYQKPNGKACVDFKGKPVLLNRLVLEVKLGRELKGAEQANHSCHTGSCINPDHLYAGTQQENADHYCQAGLAPGRKLSVKDVRKIRRQLAAGKRLSAIAKRFDVSVSAVYDIHRGKSWRGVS